MFEKFAEVERRFIELEESLASGKLTGAQLTQASKDRAAIEDIVRVYRELRQTQEQLADAKQMLGETDQEMVALAKTEVQSLQEKESELSRELTLLSLPKDPNDNKNIYLEIRAGTGGEESSLFAADLLRMYTRYAEGRGWRVEYISSAPSSTGGYKEVITMIKGDGVFSRLKFESGVHRVQRIPQTETQGRIHTSACTVAILPEVDDIEVEINPNDIEITLCRASGSGGQHLNTTDSAVRIFHKPTGIAVECQDERSQHKNKDKAMKVLKARIYERMLDEQQKQISSDRKSQVGSGDRSERIRTYNFPQGRMTDHRINLTLYKLSDIIEGDIDDILDALGTNYQAELLKKTNL